MGFKAPGAAGDVGLAATGGAAGTDLGAAGCDGVGAGGGADGPAGAGGAGGAGEGAGVCASACTTQSVPMAKAERRRQKNEESMGAPITGWLILEKPDHRLVLRAQAR